MIRALTTLIYGVLVAVLIIAVAVLAATAVIGLAAKAALFGEPKASLAMKAFEVATKRSRKASHADITPITLNHEHKE